MARQTTNATLGLRELVFDGELAPGERLPEIELSERLGVSRTPLRIALGTLAHEGLLDRLPGGGFVVRSFSRGEVVDAIELRGVLEGTAARFAAERLTSSRALASLEQTTAELDDVVGELGDETMLRYVELNERFHAGVVALPFAGPSAFLASQAVLPGSREILVVAQHHHRCLVDAIRDGHGTRAEEIAREHARLARLNLDLVLSNHEALARMRGAPLLAGPAGR